MVKAAQKIREYLVPRRRLRGARLRPKHGDAHFAHQPLHPLAIDGKTLGSQQCR
jgi:hypothetical protein